MNKTVFLRICFLAVLIAGVVLFVAPSYPVAASNAAGPSEVSMKIPDNADFDGSIKIKIGLSVLGVAGSGFGIFMINRSKNPDKKDHKK